MKTIIALFLAWAILIIAAGPVVAEVIEGGYGYGIQENSRT